MSKEASPPPFPASQPKKEHNGKLTPLRALPIFTITVTGSANLVPFLKKINPKKFKKST
jgi:hypothetical protein